MARFIVPRKEMAQMGWPQPLIELVAQLADFAQAQTDLQQAQADLGTAQEQITALEGDVGTLQTDVANAPLLVPPRLPSDDGYTDEQVRDVIGAALAAGAGITITVNDGADSITIASTISAYTDEQVRDVIGAALTAGAGVTVTVNDAGDTITVASTITQYTDEQVRDVIGAALVAGTGITITVNDAGDTITLTPNIGTAAEFRANTADKLLSTDKVWSSAAYVSLTDAATVAVDMSTGYNFTVTLGGNRTLGNPSNTKDGQVGVIEIKQDGTGSRTLAYSSNWKFAGGAAPVLTTTASARDLLFYQVINSTVIFASLIKDAK